METLNLLDAAGTPRAERDPMVALWHEIRQDARRYAGDEPSAAAYLENRVINLVDWREALAHNLSLHLARPGDEALDLHAALLRGLSQQHNASEEVAADLLAIRERDPACRGCLDAFLFWKGFHALQTHRAAHWHWQRGWRMTALLLQHQASLAFAVDIHPAAHFGKGVFLDHATGFVAGETAVVEDDVNLLHGVTLGGRASLPGDRHPKVRRGATIGAGAILLGNLEVGAGAKVGAGTTLLHSVPAGRTAVGQSARLIDIPLNSSQGI